MDYTVGRIIFNEAVNGKTVLISFTGRGNALIPVSRIYTKTQNGQVIETLEELTDRGAEALEQVNRVQEVIDQALTATQAAIDASLDAQTTGQFANDQGEYAKDQGNYAKTQAEATLEAIKNTAVAGRPSVSVYPYKSGDTLKVDISWSSVYNADRYHVYINDNAGSTDYYRDTIYGNSYTTTVDREWWDYTAKVKAGNDSGDANVYGLANFRSKDRTSPNIKSWYAVDIGTTFIKMYVEATDYYGSGMHGFEFWIDGNRQPKSIPNPNPGTTSFSASYTFTGLKANTRYNLEVTAYDVEGNSLDWSEYVTTKKRTLFEWKYPKTPGGNFFLTSDEWNQLTSNINYVRDLNGLSEISFTPAPYGDRRVYAFMFNQAVNAMSGLNYRTPPPSQKYPGDIIYASDLNLLVSSINSVN